MKPSLIDTRYVLKESMVEINGYKDVNLKAVNELGDILVAGLHNDSTPVTS